MTYQQHMLRPAMTAIAAAMVLTATPSIAQSVETTPPLVDMTPATTTPDPLAADPVVTTTADPLVSEETAPVAATANTASKPTARSRPAPVRNRTATTTAMARPAAAASAPAIAAAPVAALPAPIAAETAVPVPAAPLAAPAPVAVNDGVTANEALPIAGAAGLGLLALFGAGMAMRRRRRNEDEYAENDVEYVEPEAMIEPEPTPSFVRTPQADPVPVAVPVAAAAGAAGATKLPSGFDISRFGPHVQAAYRGPTPDNPSVSLKRRLTVGHFLDKEEGAAAPAAAEPSPSEAASVPATKPAWAARPDGDFMFRRDDKQPGLRPTFVK